MRSHVTAYSEAVGHFTPGFDHRDEPAARAVSGAPVSHPRDGIRRKGVHGRFITISILVGVRTKIVAVSGTVYEPDPTEACGNIAW
jgi:hypothetical protein